MSLLTNPEDVPPLSSYPDTHKTSLQDFSYYNLPCVEALFREFHAAARFPVYNTSLESIKAGNFTSWTVLIYHNMDKSCIIPKETIKVHMVQVHQGIRSNKKKPQIKRTKATSLHRDTTSSHEIHIRVKHLSNLYTDDTGRFPVRS